MDEFDKWCEGYINDEQTKKFYGEWAKEIAEEKAERKGFSEGKTQGIYDVARNLLKLNISKKDISKATGLSLKELENLN